MEDIWGGKKIPRPVIKSCGEGAQLCSFCVPGSCYWKAGDIVCHDLWVIGHASPTTTARYAHSTELTEKDTISAINQLTNTLSTGFRSQS